MNDELFPKLGLMKRARASIKTVLAPAFLIARAADCACPPWTHVSSISGTWQFREVGEDRSQYRSQGMLSWLASPEVMAQTTSASRLCPQSC